MSERNLTTCSDGQLVADRLVSGDQIDFLALVSVVALTDALATLDGRVTAMHGEMTAMRIKN